MAKKLVEMPSFDRTLNRLLDRTVSRANRLLLSRANDLQKELFRLNTTFYSTLARKIVGVAGPPDLGKYSPSAWEPLSQKTIAMKNNSLFYLKTRKLQQWLLSHDANLDIGTPEVIIQKAGKQSGIKGRIVEVIRTTSTGRKWVQRIGIGPNGKFIPTKALEQELKSSLKIYPFGMRRANYAGGQDVSFIAPRSKIVRYKLSNPKGKELRPIASEYLRWWLDVQVGNAIKRFSK